jgi:hypothetical protein
MAMNPRASERGILAFSRKLLGLPIIHEKKNEQNSKIETFCKLSFA